MVHERSAVKNSFSTYVWSKVDSCFCESVYSVQMKYATKKMVDINSIIELVDGTDFDLRSRHYSRDTKPFKGRNFPVE